MTHLVRSAASRPVEEADRASAPTAPTRWSVTLLRVLVRVLVALGLGLLAFVFLEAWLPGVVVDTIGSWFVD